MTVEGEASSDDIKEDRGVPQNLVIGGVAVGLLLVLLGVALLLAGKTSLIISLMTCVGFGLVLAAFGSKAGGAWGGWTATGAGAGAMSILLFLILQHYAVNSVLKRGQLRGTFTKVADLRIIDEIPLYQYRDPTTASIRFVFLEAALKSKRMSVQVDTTEKMEGREFFELVGNSEVIASNYLTKPSGVAQWTFDYEKRTIKDGAQIIFAEPDKLAQDASKIKKRVISSA